jgi:hypothetical protein
MLKLKPVKTKSIFLIRTLLFYDVKSMENPAKKATKSLTISENGQNSQISIHDKDRTLFKKRVLDLDRSSRNRASFLDSGAIHGNT